MLYRKSGYFCCQNIFFLFIGPPNTQDCGMSHFILDYFLNTYMYSLPDLNGALNSQLPSRAIALANGRKCAPTERQQRKLPL